MILPGVHDLHPQPRGDAGGLQDVPRPRPEEEDLLPSWLLLQDSPWPRPAQTPGNSSSGLHGGCEEQEHLREASHQAPVGQGTHDQPRLEGEERQD